VQQKDKRAVQHKHQRYDSNGDDDNSDCDSSNNDDDDNYVSSGGQHWRLTAMAME
jgi:hypothetical protein